MAETQVWEIKGFLRFVGDPATGEYRYQFWNSTAGVWEDINVYDAVNKLAKALATIADDIKFYLGTDKDYSVRYDSTADAYILRDEVNAVDILQIGRNGLISVVGNLADGLKFPFGTDRDYALRYDDTNDAIVLSDEVNAVDVLRIGRNGLITIVGNLADDVEFPFGTDKDFAITFNSTAGVLEIRDKINGTAITVPANQNRNLGVFTKHRYAEETTGVTNGASGTPAEIVRIDVSNSDFMSLLPLNFSATPAGLATRETVTYRIVATLDDGTTVELWNSGAVSTAVNGSISNCDFSGIADGRRIVTLSLTAESSTTAPTSTSTGYIAAFEAD